MTDAVLLTRNGAVATLTLNRPAIRNPISERDVVDTLVAHLEEIEADRSVRVAILTGAGKAFSSGGDLKKMLEAGGALDRSAAENRRYYTEGIQRIPLTFHRLEVPVIAAVNGPAIGAGCDLACMCDIRIAAASASFAESFVKVGLIPGDGGAWLLPRAVGLSKAFEMSLTGDTIGASAALACGLVSSVVPDEDLLPAANRLAERIAANPPDAVRMTKRLIREGQSMSLAGILQLSAAMQSITHTSGHHREALTAFAEKRRPVFD